MAVLAVHDYLICCINWIQCFDCLQCFDAVGWTAGRASGL